MRSLARALAFCLLAGTSWAAGAPSPLNAAYTHRVWGTREGLPQNTVTSIVRTRDGYLWLGTFGGLVRFDGDSFTVFDPGNRPGLPSARVVSLYEDRKGTLWIGTENGLARYDAGRFSFAGLAHQTVLGVVEDKRGRLWVVGSQVYRYDGVAFEADEVSPHLGPWSVAATGDGDVWVGSVRALARFRGDSLMPELAPPGRIHRTLLTDTRGRFWLGSHVLERWDGPRHDDVRLPGFDGIPLRSRTVLGLSEDRDGSLWIATGGAGLYRWRDGAVERFTTREGLSDDHVRAVFADRDGTVWIGTEVGGLNRLQPRRVTSYERSGSLQSIVPITDDGQGGLWIGAACGGLLNFREGRYRVYSEKDGLRNTCIWALHRDLDGVLWVGTAGDGLLRFENGRFTRYISETGLDFANVFAIQRGRDGALWVGSHGGLGRLEDGRFTNYKHAAIPTVSFIMPDRRGTLWVGGMGGVARFENGRFTTTYTKADGLSHDHVRAIHEDADGALWIGTYGGGLNRIKNGRITSIGIKEGLFDSAVSRIIEDERGNLWMSGNRGVFRVPRRELDEFADGLRKQVTSVSYGTEDGMVTEETNGGGQPAGWRTPDGTLWFPTIKGLISIAPGTDAVRPPPVFIERAVVDGSSLDLRQPATLGPGRGDAEFHYTAAELRAPGSVRFRYRLDGQDEEWIDAGTRRVAYYTNVPPGPRRFRVTAMSDGGVWNETEAVIEFNLRPPFWRTTPFYGACMIGLVSMGLGAHRLRVRQLERRERARLDELYREQALARERARIARDLHDDIGSRLSHIAILAGVRPSAERDTGIAQAAGAAIATMDELVWAVNARNDTLDSFANYVGQFAEQHAAAAGIRCRLDFPAELPARPLDAERRRHLYLALKEAVNNAVKHARATEIVVRLRVQDDTLVVEVSDDGRGLPAEVDPTGNGLKNLRERMDAVDGRLGVDSAPGHGTRISFTMRLPA